LQRTHNKTEGPNIMMTSQLKRLLFITCCCLAGMPQIQADAGAIYTWVDAHGVTHFSETPPPDPAVQPAMIDLRPLSPPPPSDYDDYYSVIRQAERMERRRLENEKLEAERLQAEAETMRARREAEAAMQPPPDNYADTNSVYLPAYPYYPGYGPGHGDKPWRPGNRPGRPGYWPDQPGYWPGQPGHPRPGPGFRPPSRSIGSITARP
jgi:hypothetical protein